MILSRGALNTACRATVSSTTPRPAPRWPPVTDTAEMVSARSSSASWRNSRSFNAFISEGSFTRSRIGVASVGGFGVGAEGGGIGRGDDCARLGGPADQGAGLARLKRGDLGQGQRCGGGFGGDIKRLTQHHALGPRGFG